MVVSGSSLLKSNSSTATGTGRALGGKGQEAVEKDQKFLGVPVAGAGGGTPRRGYPGLPLKGDFSPHLCPFRGTFEVSIQVHVMT
eukprot:gene3412-13455_t